MHSIIQSVLFNIQNWTVQKAVEWLQETNLKCEKFDITDRFLRFRQVSPERLRAKGYINYETKRLNNNIELIIASKPNGSHIYNLR
jgi:hypothetical protein